MQPEFSPPDNARVSPWHYATLLPTFLSIIAVILSSLSWFGEWGGGTHLSTGMAIVFSQAIIAVSIIGLFGFAMQETHCKRKKVIALWNCFLLLGATLCTVYLYSY